MTGKLRFSLQRASRDGVAPSRPWMNAYESLKHGPQLLPFAASEPGLRPRFAFWNLRYSGIQAAANLQASHAVLPKGCWEPPRSFILTLQALQNRGVQPKPTQDARLRELRTGLNSAQASSQGLSTDSHRRPEANDVCFGVRKRVSAASEAHTQDSLAEALPRSGRQSPRVSTTEIAQALRCSRLSTRLPKSGPHYGWSEARVPTP